MLYTKKNKKNPQKNDLDKSLQEVLGINITLEHSHLSLVPSHPCPLMSEKASGKVSEFSCHVCIAGRQKRTFVLTSECIVIYYRGRLQCPFYERTLGSAYIGHE